MKIVAIDHAMVGHQFFESLADAGPAGARVSVLGEEPRAACDRVHLSAFFAGKTAADLRLVEPGCFARTGDKLRLGARAVTDPKVRPRP